MKCLDVIWQVLLEAQEMAVHDHNVEFKSNLWIGAILCFISDLLINILEFIDH